MGFCSNNLQSCDFFNYSLCNKLQLNSHNTFCHNTLYVMSEFELSLNTH